MTASPILLVEDNQADVMLIERAIRKAGIGNPMRRVADGDEAIKYLSGEAPFADRFEYPAPILVLLDLKLPRRSGFEVLRWLRDQAGGTKRLPVIILTSSSEEADVNRAYDLGANSYLVKPGAPDDLLRILKSLDEYWLTLNRNPRIG